MNTLVVNINKHFIVVEKITFCLQKSVTTPFFPFPRTPQHKPSPAESPRGTPTNKPPRSYDEQLRLAMELSAREQEEAELRQRREEEELQRIIQLSLMEKWQRTPAGTKGWEEHALGCITNVSCDWLVGSNAPPTSIELHTGRWLSGPESQRNPSCKFTSN